MTSPGSKPTNAASTSSPTSITPAISLTSRLERAHISVLVAAGNTAWTYKPRATAIDFAAFAATYLSCKHRDNPGIGCLFSTLAQEATRASDAARMTMTESARSQIENFSQSMVGETDVDRRQAAVGNWAAMIGAVTLSRVLNDPALSDQVLADVKAWLERSNTVEK